MVIVAVVIFLLAHAIGNPVAQLLPPGYTPVEYQALSHSLGYDRPLIEQFAKFVANSVTGNLGTSTTFSEPVVDVLAARVPVTAVLAIAALAVGLTIGVLGGFVAGFTRARALDSILTVLATVGLATPAFAVGMVLILIFAVTMHVLPAGGWGDPAQIVLPVCVLSFWTFASVARVARATMRERASSEYVALARTKGLSATGVFVRHALRPSIAPVASYSAVLAVNLFSGAVVTEALFGIPGVGSAAVQAVKNRDQPLVIGVVLFVALVFVVLNLVADLLTMVVDPRIRLDRERTT
jgi:peptide/nickel transport system permease protein